MKEKSLKIVIGVCLIIIVILVAMILLKGKNLNPFTNEGNNPMQERQEGTLHEAISIPPTEEVQIYDFEGEGTVTIDAGEMNKQEIGE